MTTTAERITPSTRASVLVFIHFLFSQTPQCLATNESDMSAAAPRQQASTVRSRGDSGLHHLQHDGKGKIRAVGQKVRDSVGEKAQCCPAGVCSWVPVATRAEPVAARDRREALRPSQQPASRPQTT